MAGALSLGGVVWKGKRDRAHDAEQKRLDREEAQRQRMHEAEQNRLQREHEVRLERLRLEAARGTDEPEE